MPACRATIAQTVSPQKHCTLGAGLHEVFDFHFNFRFISSVITRRFRDFVPPATRVMEKGLASEWKYARFSAYDIYKMTKTSLRVIYDP